MADGVGAAPRHLSDLTPRPIGHSPRLAEPERIPAYRHGNMAGMTDPDPVLAALQAALADNEHPDLHAALGRHLSEIGRKAEALHHLREALAADPADVDLLRLAAAAATDAGQTEAAAGYHRLLTALDPARPTDPPPPPPPPPAAPTPSIPADARFAHPTLSERVDDLLGDDDPGDNSVDERVSVGESDDQFDSFLKEVLAEDRAERGPAQRRRGDAAGEGGARASLLPPDPQPGDPEGVRQAGVRRTVALRSTGMREDVPRQGDRR